MTKKYDFTQIDTLKKKLDKLRPMNADIYQKVKHKLNIDWTYNSNAIEGNTLSLSETRFFLEQGLTSKGKPLSEYLEMKNHQFALNYLDNILKDKTPLTEVLIKELHSMLFERNEEYEIEDEKGNKVKTSVLPGKYKKQNNYVLLPDGTRKFYMDPLQVVDAMQELITFYEDEKGKMHPILLAAEMHTRFVAIHPFVDGNGRVARLIMNIVLMQAGYQPAVIRNELKQDYYDALRYYDEKSDISNIVEIIEQEATRTLQITLNAAKGEKVFDKKDISKRLDTFAHTMSALDKDIGTLSKKVTPEEKAKSILAIKDYLFSIAKEKIEGYETEIFEFNIVNLKKDNNIERRLSELVENNEVVPVRAAPDSPNSNSSFGINLKSKRAFIPTSSCYFAVISTKYTLCVTYGINISTLAYSGEEEHRLYNMKTGKIENGVLWEDWNKKDLEIFFTEVFEQFLAMAQDEAEERREQMEKK